MGVTSPELGNDTALPSQLRLTVLRLSRRLRQQAVGQITASQLSALATVSLHGELSLGELAAVERIAPPSMTRIATGLEEQGLVERRVDESDRRIARVVITGPGQELLQATRTRRDAYLAGRLQRLTPEEREILAAAAPLLERLALEEDVAEQEPV